MGQTVYSSIKFGTDGWRGIIGFDFNMANLSRVVVASCQELKFQYSDRVKSKKILIGYDRRFMAEHFAKSIIPFVNACGLEVILSSSFVTTPSCSLYVRELNILGALVITASHNPYNWLGLKIKNFQGSSVNELFTKEVERRIKLGNITEPIKSNYQIEDIKQFHIEKINSYFDMQFILDRLRKMNIKVFIDAMHGSSAESINQLFHGNAQSVIQGIREEKDPYFSGNPPEPLINYLDELKNTLLQKKGEGFKTLGIVFDGDGDRIAVIDEKGRYCSTQVLLPYFINFLGKKAQNNYPVIKTVSGSDVITKIAEGQNRNVFELPVGFKHIAEKMIKEKILIGGEESGGIGFGHFLPERDALFASIVLLDCIAKEEKYLCDSLDEIQRNYGPSFYDRIDINFPDHSKKNALKNYIFDNIPKYICDYEVKSVSHQDGIKLRIDNNYWVLFRFSGTEPLLRLYCEAPSEDSLKDTLSWSKIFIKNIIS